MTHQLFRCQHFLAQARLVSTGILCCRLAGTRLHLACPLVTVTCPAKPCLISHALMVCLRGLGLKIVRVLHSAAALALTAAIRTASLGMFQHCLQFK